MFWLFLIIRLFCICKSDNLKRNEAQNFHRPLGNHELRLTETRGLKGRELHEATSCNAETVLHWHSDREKLISSLECLSTGAIKRIGKCLGLLAPSEKGSPHSLAETLAVRFIGHRKTIALLSRAKGLIRPNTYTDCKRQIVIIFD